MLEHPEHPPKYAPGVLRRHGRVLRRHGRILLQRFATFLQFPSIGVMRMRSGYIPYIHCSTTILHCSTTIILYVLKAYWGPREQSTNLARVLLIRY